MNDLPSSHAVSLKKTKKMASFYDEIEIEDFVFDSELDLYTFPCPCGDKFQIMKVYAVFYTI